MAVEALDVGLELAKRMNHIAKVSNLTMGTVAQASNSMGFRRRHGLIESL